MTDPIRILPILDASGKVMYMLSHSPGKGNSPMPRLGVILRNITCKPAGLPIFVSVRKIVNPLIIVRRGHRLNKSDFPFEVTANAIDRACGLMIA